MHITALVSLLLALLLICRRIHRLTNKRRSERLLPANVALNLVPAGLNCPDLRGIIGYEMKVLEFLEHATTSVLGISGKRGIGKSALLRLVYTSTKRSSFRYVFFVEAVTGFTSDRLQAVLARNIGLRPMPGFPTVDRIASFLRDESFVLLLDNVCTSFGLAAAGLPMPLGQQQKVVFTTRDESICDEMASAGDSIRMDCMEKDVAWDLFKYYAGAKIVDAHSEIKNIAMKMVAECRGIPKALRTIGCFMASQKDVREWRVAYEMLMVKRSPINEIEDINDQDYPCLDYFEHQLGTLSFSHV